MNKPITDSTKLCKLFGHNYIALETRNWGRYVFGDGSHPRFMGQQVSKLWCQRCKHRVDDVKRLLTEKDS